ncbi:MAG: NAD(P)/FAD-dependent oxidoreductase [Clostridiaceae bacterium]
MKYQCIIVGGGSSGMYTALGLKKRGINDILILDMEEDLGGALNVIIESEAGFGKDGYTGVEIADDLKKQIILHGIDYRVNTYVISITKGKKITAVSPKGGVEELEADSVVIATGAAERPRGILNFTSNRSAGLYSIGTARDFLVEKGYLCGKRVVIYGDDWTGLYMARILINEGATEVTIVDEVKELNFPDEELKEFFELYNIKTELGYIITEIEGKDRVTGVVIEKLSKKEGEEVTKRIECDTLLLSVGLSPSRQLFKRFKRDADGSGAFITGNADEVTFNITDIWKRAEITAEEVYSYLTLEQYIN